MNKKTLRRILIILPFALLLLLAIFFSVRACVAPELPRNCRTQYSHVALTDCRGEEYVYKKGDPVFACAATAFSTAEPADEKPSWATREGMILLDWIRDGYARRFRLYLSRTSFAVYLEDERESGYYLRDISALFVYKTDAALPSLIGKMPSPVLLDGEEVSFHLASWQYDFTDSSGKTHTFSSKEYFAENDTVKTISDPSDFSLSFREEPISLRYHIFSGEDEIYSDSARPTTEDLPAGEYQLIVIAEYKEGVMKTRGGYAFRFSIA